MGLSLGGAPLQGIIVDEYLHTIPRYDFIPGFPSRPYSARGYTLDTGRGTSSGPIASWALRRVRGAA